MQILFHRWDPETKGPKLVEFFGVRAPNPPGRYAFDKYKAQYKEKYGLERLSDGLASAREVLLLLQDELARMITHGAYALNPDSGVPEPR